MGKLIAANWKEHPKTEEAARALFSAVARVKRPRGAEVLVCPPFLYLEGIAARYGKMAKTARRGLTLGAQDVFWAEEGAFTSEIGPKMLRSLGVRYAIVGHSERRKFEGETDGTINKKIALALRDGLKVILCVGEGAAVRRKGVAAAKAFVRGQLAKDLKGISPERGTVIVAYEPIWAIGTGYNDRPEDAREMARFVKSWFATHKRVARAKFLYGGSVNGANAADYVQLKEVDGALVGGASLKAEEFAKIINAVGYIN